MSRLSARRSLTYAPVSCLIGIDVRSGSEADIAPVKSDVGFVPESRHCQATVGCPLSAIMSLCSIVAAFAA
jgi:hypothetical protein